MLSIVELLFGCLPSLLKSRRLLQAENLVLRHQVNILRRQAPRRIRLSNPGRLVFVWLYRLCPTVVDAVAIIRPEKLIRWHRRGFRAFWRWKSRSSGGRPTVHTEMAVALVVLGHFLDARRHQSEIRAGANQMVSSP